MREAMPAQHPAETDVIERDGTVDRAVKPPRQRALRLVDMRLEVGEGDFDGQLGPGGAELLYGAGHEWDS